MTRITGSLCEDEHTFMLVLCWIFHSNTYFIFNNFFPKVMLFMG